MFDRNTNDNVSSTLVSAFYDMEELQDLINQQQRYNAMKAGNVERRPICAQMSLDSVLTTRTRNYSVGGFQGNNGLGLTSSSTSANMGPITNGPIPGSFHVGTSSSSSSSSASSPTASSTPSLISINDSAFTVPVREHRKLDRSASEPGDRLSSLLANNNGGLVATARGLNSTRYKTELCRPFEESGYCRYGDKCQFAHGEHELRNLSRHPKYKTEPCRTYHTVGFCPYGARCHFMHNEDERNLCLQQQQQQLQMQQQRHMSGESQTSTAPCNLNMSHPGPVRRPKSINFSSSLSSLGSTADSPPSSVTDSPSLSPTFFGEEFPYVQSSYNSGLTSSTHTLPSHAASLSLGTYNQSNVTNVTNINAVFNLATAAATSSSLAVNKPVPGVIESSSSSSGLGTFNTDALSSLMSPLNVQTQLGNLNSSILLNNLLNQYNNHGTQNVFESSPPIIDTDSHSNFLDLSDLQYELLVGAPPSPPDSVSGDSLASSMSSSTGSLENSHAPCGSPTDRLSVFRKLQVESC